MGFSIRERRHMPTGTCRYHSHKVSTGPAAACWSAGRSEEVTLTSVRGILYLIHAHHIDSLFGRVA